MSMIYIDIIQSGSQSILNRYMSHRQENSLISKLRYSVWIPNGLILVANAQTERYLIIFAR